MRIALIMGQKDSIACQFGWITTGDDVDEIAAIADAIEGCRLARDISGGRHTRTQSKQETKTLGMARKGCGGDPRIIAGFTGWNENTAKA